MIMSLEFLWFGVEWWEWGEVYLMYCWKLNDKMSRYLPGTPLAPLKDSPYPSTHPRSSHVRASPSYSQHFTPQNSLFTTTNTIVFFSLIFYIFFYLLSFSCKNVFFFIFTLTVWWHMQWQLMAWFYFQQF